EEGVPGGEFLPDEGGEHRRHCRRRFILPDGEGLFRELDLVPVKSGTEPSGRHVPQLNRIFLTNGRGLAVRAETHRGGGNTPGVIRVPLAEVALPPGRDVPKDDGVVPIHRGQGLAVRAEAQALRVFLEGEALLPRDGVPELDGVGIVADVAPWIMVAGRD